MILVNTSVEGLTACREVRAIQVFQLVVVDVPAIGFASLQPQDPQQDRQRRQHERPVAGAPAHVPTCVWMRVRIFSTSPMRRAVRILHRHLTTIRWPHSAEWWTRKKKSNSG